MQVLEEGEIFDPQEFLDGLAQQWKQDPSSTLQTSAEPFMNLPPPTRSDTQILYSCPRHPNDTLEKKNTNTQYGYWEYYKCPLKHRLVSCDVNDIEYRVCQMSTPRLLPDQTHAHYEVLLPSSIDHVHVPVREESRETVLQMSQTLERFLPMGGSRTPRPNQSMA